jgi:hypothetical protein
MPGGKARPLLRFGSGSSFYKIGELAFDRLFETLNSCQPAIYFILKLRA